MPTLSLLFGVLFITTALAATSQFGKNVVPFIPQVRQFRFLMPILCAVLNNFPVLFFQLERSDYPVAKPHDRPM